MASAWLPHFTVFYLTHKPVFFWDHGGAQLSGVMPAVLIRQAPMHTGQRCPFNSTVREHMHMRLFNAAGLIVLFISGLSFSQQTAPQSQVERCLRASGFITAYIARAQTVLRFVETQPPTFVSRELASFVNLLTEERLLPILARTYSQFLSEDEASELADFFESPTGRKIMTITTSAYSGNILTAQKISISEEDKKYLIRTTNALALMEKFLQVTQSKELKQTFATELDKATEAISTK
jgi:Uncharacterized protein conserved in bacteria (DUF2059)